MSPHESSVVEWPRNAFYWAVLDASALPPRAARNQESLSYLLEPLVPEPLESLHAVFHRLGDGRVVACAASRERLETLPAGTLELRPSGVPEFVAGEVAASELNLLVGDYEPAPVRAGKRALDRELRVLVTLAFVLVCIGLWRRADRASARAEELGASIRDAYVDALGAGALASPLPLELSMESTLRQLRKTRLVRTEEVRSNDAARDLQDLLTRWPDDVPAETNSIHVTPEAIHVVANLRSADQVQRFVAALEGLAGWTARPPAVRSSAQGMLVTLQFQRESGTP